MGVNNPNDANEGGQRGCSPTAGPLSSSPYSAQNSQLCNWHSPLPECTLECFPVTHFLDPMSWGSSQASWGLPKGHLFSIYLLPPGHAPHQGPESVLLPAVFWMERKRLAHSERSCSCGLTEPLRIHASPLQVSFLLQTRASFVRMCVRSG